MSGPIISFLLSLSGANQAQAVALNGPNGGTPFPVGAGGRYYQLVAASQALTAVGPTGGGIGDDIDQIWIYPADLAATGLVSVADNNTAIWIYPAAQTITTLAPIFVPLNLKSKLGPWKIQTGASVAVLASGLFK